MADWTTTVLVDGLCFPEGPRWRHDRLYFSDMHDAVVHSADLDGNLKSVAEVPHRPSGLGWLPDDTLVVVSMDDHRLLRVDADHVHEYADLSAHMFHAANDLCVDVHGRAYVGNFGFDLFGGGEPRPTNLVMVTPKGDVRVVAGDMHFPNGIVMSDDGATLIVAETFGRRLSAFDVATDGSLGHRRVFAALDCMPDGICLDADGCVWVADPVGGDVVRVAEGGAVLDRVRTCEGAHAVACMLGGPGRRTLFVCTAGTILPEDAHRLRGGRIETVDVVVPGAGLP